MRSLAFLLFFQSFVSCRQGQENVQPVEAGIVSPFMTAGLPDPGEAQAPAANIVFQSTDGGKTWQDVSAGLTEKMEIQGVFTAGGEVFLGSMNGLYRNNSRTPAPVWEQMPFLYGRITDVFPGRDGLYACSYGQGLFQNMPGTDIWRPMSNTLGNITIRTVVETPEGILFIGSDNGIFRSVDSGQTWKQVFDKGMVLNLVASGGVLIGGGAQGVLRSTDGGEHWEYVLNENILAKRTGFIGDRFITILGTEDPSKVSPEGITNRLRTSADGGKTWQRMEQALLPVQAIYHMDERLSQVRDIYDIIQVGEYLLCSFDTGIFRSSDQGKTWEPVFSVNGKGSFNLSVCGQVIYAVQGGGC